MYTRNKRGGTFKMEATQIIKSQEYAGGAIEIKTDEKGIILYVEQNNKHIGILCLSDIIRISRIDPALLEKLLTTLENLENFEAAKN